MSKSTEQNLNELHNMRILLIPPRFVDDSEKREKNLADLKSIRKAISPYRATTDEERKKFSAGISYIINTVRKR